MLEGGGTLEGACRLQIDTFNQTQREEDIKAIRNAIRSIAFHFQQVSRPCERYQVMTQFKSHQRFPIFYGSNRQNINLRGQQQDARDLLILIDLDSICVRTDHS